MIIVLDGPSGSGKSTLAKMLSKEFNIPYFDTGAMYRSFCWLLLHHHISLDDHNAIKAILRQINFEIKAVHGHQHYLINGHDVTREIRDEKVTQNVSKISAYLYVRETLVNIQREFGKNNEAVFEGRDMGTVVFPNANIKFFLYADPVIRATRRFEQLVESFPNKQFDREKVLQELIVRDQNDSQREHSPLKPADDAVLIDVSYLTLEEVFEKLKKYIQERRV